ncbi:MAG: RIP metalloprotease RseP [Patescibacteria group bacterium]|nr:MAG: RIP metalloprotease RseP [Patescibacteria group bacterium]
MDILSLVRFILLLSILIFVHEGGHFLMAKLSGVKVEEFGFGLPPRLWGKRVGGTIYSLNLLPIGGFVRMKGEMGETLGFGSSDSFAVQSKVKRVLIVGAGVLGNLVLAWIIFSVLAGLGTSVPAGKVLVQEVRKDSPAAVAGISAGDFILSFEGKKTETAEALSQITRENLGQASVLEVESGGQIGSVIVIPRADPPEGEGSLGVIIISAVKETQVSFWRAPFSGLVYTFQALGDMVGGFGRILVNLFRGVEVQVGGPVAIYALTEMYASGGLKIFAQFTALLSLNLVVLNLLPIPALDGGRILFIALEAIRRKKLSPRVEQMINSLGFAFLLLLIALITLRDIQTFF